MLAVDHKGRIKSEQALQYLFFRMAREIDGAATQ
jgi:hypothetical protein